VAHDVDGTAINGNGSILVEGDITIWGSIINNTSDSRLKKDVTEVSNALGLVSQIRPVYYNWIDETHNSYNPGHKEMGFIAQELETVVPELVRTTDKELNGNANIKTISYEHMVSLLVGAIKELKAEIEDLKK